MLRAFSLLTELMARFLLHFEEVMLSHRTKQRSKLHFFVQSSEKHFLQMNARMMVHLVVADVGTQFHLKEKLQGAESIKFFKR